MADIDVERKGPSIWPWIIGLLVLALIVWAVAEMLGPDEAEFAETERVETVEPVPPAATPRPGTEPAQPIP